MSPAGGAMRRKIASSYEDKIAWLLLHQREWQGWPGAQRETAWKLAKAMRAAGLYSRRTSVLDIMIGGQERLINEARRRRRLKVGRA